MKIVERMLERGIQEFVDFDAMQFGFMPGRGTKDKRQTCWLWEECKRNIEIRRKSCVCVLLMLRRHSIEFQES